VKTRIALGVLAALATMQVMAAEPTGLYLGFDLGQSSWDVDMRDAENELLTVLEDEGLDVLDASTETSDSAFTWGLHLGYQIWPFFAVEAGYLDLGEAEYKARGTVTDGINTSDVAITANIDSSGFVLSALGMVPLGHSGWDIFGRAGVYFGSNDLEGSLTVDEVVDSGKDDTSSESFMWGAGVSYTGGQWTTRLEYQQYMDVGDDGNFDGMDVDRIVLGAVYRTSFGAWRSKAPAAAAPVVAAPVAAAAPPPPPPPPAAPMDSDGDGVIDANDRCPATPAGERVGPLGCSCDVTAQLQFAFDSAELTPEDRSVLDRVAARLGELQFAGGEVAGYTDSVGDESYNLDLSKRRAQSALDYLASVGVAPGRMTAVGYGEAMPIADNSTEEGRALNRRVVIRRTDCAMAQ